MSLTLTAVAHAVSLQDFHRELLTPYVEQAQQEIQKAHDDLQYANHGDKEIIWTGKSFAKELYPKQKKALKKIKKNLEAEAHQLKDAAPHTYLTAYQCYKSFKHEVYKPWKKTVKNQYKAAQKNGEWEWMHNQTIGIVVKNQGAQ